MEPKSEYIGSNEADANFYAIICALIAILITTILYFYYRKKSVVRRNILITGISEAGKTILFSRLISSKNIKTYTSMKENFAVIKTSTKKNLTIVDVPGNERLRIKYLEEFLPTSRGIMFVIDSLNFPKEIRDVAGLLYLILQEPIIYIYRIPLLIVCNKQDHDFAKSAKVIQTQLEKELNALRITQTGQLASISSSDDKLFLGHIGKDFVFADLKGIKIEFCECSALEPGKGKPTEILTPIWNWLSKVA